MPASPDPAHRRIADRYTLHEHLGVGGMGHVWRATDERLDRSVAVKLLRGDLADDQARSRFAAEGRAVARIHHPNVVEIFDAGVDGELSYLVMTALSGRTLKDRMAEGPLTDTDARTVVGDVLAALEAAHAAGIVHRDVKPSNVLLDGDRWRVADFGIAKPLVSSPAEADLTRTGEVHGTPAYLAPERLAGHPATVASDVYSVGVILHEALAGRPDADPDLVAAADRATRRDPAQRFASAASMAAAVAGRPTTAVPAGASPIGPDDATVALAATTQVLDVPPAAPRRMAPRRTAGRRAAWVAVAVAALLAGTAVAFAARDDGGSGVPADDTSTSTTTASTSETSPATAAAEPATTVTPTTVPATTSPSTSTTTTTTEPVKPTKPEKPEKPGKPGKG